MSGRARARSERWCKRASPCYSCGGRQDVDSPAPRQGRRGKPRDVSRKALQCCSVAVLAPMELPQSPRARRPTPSRSVIIVIVRLRSACCIDATDEAGRQQQQQRHRQRGAAAPPRCCSACHHDRAGGRADVQRVSVMVLIILLVSVVASCRSARAVPVPSPMRSRSTRIGASESTHRGALDAQAHASSETQGERHRRRVRGHHLLGFFLGWRSRGAFAASDGTASSIRCHHPLLQAQSCRGARRDGQIAQGEVDEHGPGARAQARQAPPAGARAREVLLTLVRSLRECSCAWAREACALADAGAFHPTHAPRESHTRIAKQVRSPLNPLHARRVPGAFFFARPPHLRFCRAGMPSRLRAGPSAALPRRTLSIP